MIPCNATTEEPPPSMSDKPSPNIERIPPSRRFTSEYIQRKVCSLIDVRFYSVNEMQDADGLLRWMRARRISHAIKFDGSANLYTVAFTLPLDPPLTLVAADATLSKAISVCGARIAERAEL